MVGGAVDWCVMMSSLDASLSVVCSHAGCILFFSISSLSEPHTVRSNAANVEGMPDVAFLLILLANLQPWRGKLLDLQLWFNLQHGLLMRISSLPPFMVCDVVDRFVPKITLDGFLIGSKSTRFNYGYASFKGKRASMEDYFETTISEVDGRMVAFFGVFDGHGGSRTAEYLKNNLFKNLSGHPGFIKDTKNDIGATFRNMRLERYHVPPATYDSTDMARTSVVYYETTAATPILAPSNAQIVSTIVSYMGISHKLVNWAVICIADKKLGSGRSVAMRVESKDGTASQSRDQPPVAWIYGTIGGADALSQETDALCQLL
ncbi:probable protein phosphatase 2C 11 [Tanacetum coccineum]